MSYMETMTAGNGELTIYQLENGSFRISMRSHDEQGFYCSGSLNLTEKQVEELISKVMEVYLFEYR